MHRTPRPTQAEWQLILLVSVTLAFPAGVWLSKPKQPALPMQQAPARSDKTDYERGFEDGYNFARKRYHIPREKGESPFRSN